MSENTKNSRYREDFFKSKNSKIIAVIILVIILISAITVGIYKIEKSNLFYNINTNISNLDSTIAAFHHGLNTNEELLNPSFAQTYENNFKNLSNNFNKNSSNILNTASTKRIVSREAIKAQYYDYISQFVGAAVNYKNDFQPLVNAINNGSEITKAQAEQMENDLNTLENSNSLTEAMNLYNSSDSFLSLTVKSPYVLKQKLLNLNNALKNGNFNSSTKNNNNTNTAISSIDVLIPNLI